MASAAVASESSGRQRVERGVAGDLGARRLKKRSRKALQGFRRCVSQRGGRGRCGGASGLIDRARGGRWPWWQQTAATGALGCGAGESRGGGRSTGESEEGPGGAWHHEGGPGRRGGATSRRWPRRAPACVGHAPCVRLAGGRRPPCPWWAGPARWAAR